MSCPSHLLPGDPAKSCLSQSPGLHVITPEIGRVLEPKGGWGSGSLSDSKEGTPNQRANFYKERNLREQTHPGQDLFTGARRPTGIERAAGRPGPEWVHGQA